MPLERFGGWLAVNGPESDRTVVTAGYDTSPIWAEGGIYHERVNSPEHRNGAPGPRVPESRGVVVRRRDDARPVRRERGATHLTVMAFRDSDGRAHRGVPQPRGVI